MYDSCGIFYESAVFQKYRVKKESGEKINIQDVTRDEMLNMFNLHTNREIAELFDVTEKVAQNRRYKLGVRFQDIVYGTEFGGRKMEDVPQENTILFHITNDQVELLTRHFGFDSEDVSKMEEYEICEMLDKYIDELE